MPTPHFPSFDIPLPSPHLNIVPHLLPVGDSPAACGSPESPQHQAGDAPGYHHLVTPSHPVVTAVVDAAAAAAAEAVCVSARGVAALAAAGSAAAAAVLICC